ncbi:TPA: hypothetical protein DCP13_03970 [Candidatus Azambacteria bacterium]|uniref:Uncharacterized protein n=2 Tax=Candidatus Azamiibacteriota TaxID=1752741 RepID=A0A0G1RIL9_9BACT|nr:MAG: hypothetical protein UX33_C0038G0011 [Candidatus Azambacteria bacterium GW2011_GWC1_46_13]HAQ05918.1 hypothetical protein [Candidatus Azambacteria bacterium]
MTNEISAENVIGNIIDELGISDLPVEVQDRILSQFTENLVKSIALAIMERLPEDKREEFEKLSEAGEQEKINQFLTAQIPDYQNLVQNEVNSAKEEFKKIVESLS